MNVLSICNLSKSFGEQKIIKNLNLSVPEGSVFGFIGQNGAGKTTTMKMVLGLLQPDEGEIRVCNEPVRFGQTKTNQYIGYLPDVPEFYNYMTAIQYLTLCGEIVGLSKKIISQKGHPVLQNPFLPEELLQEESFPCFLPETQLQDKELRLYRKQFHQDLFP